MTDDQWERIIERKDKEIDKLILENRDLRRQIKELGEALNSLQAINEPINDPRNSDED